MVIEGSPGDLRQTANANGDRPGTPKQPQSNEVLPWAPLATNSSVASMESPASHPWAQTASKATSGTVLSRTYSSGVNSEPEVGLRGSIKKGRMIEKAGLQDQVFYSSVTDETVKAAIAANRQKVQETWLQKKKKYVTKKKQFHQELVKKGQAEDREVVPFLTINHPYPRTRKIVIDRRFEYAMTVLIVANCVVIGWQAGLDAEPEGTAKVVNIIIEQSFTFLFFTELLMRILVFNWTFFFASENHLDIFLVTLSVLNTWILGPMQIKADFLRKASVLRILRLVRIAKSYRTQFKEMWQLLRGIVDSMETLIWTYVMMACVLYFFAIVATILFTKMEFFDDDPYAKELTDSHFNTVLMSMFTLYQIMTLDSWTGLSRPLAKIQWWVDIFFIVFISVSVFLLMNLITAVIVDKAEMASKDDKAELLAEKAKEKENAIKEIGEVFKEIDEDGSGMIDKQELMKAWKNAKIRSKFKMMDITRKDIKTLWTALSGKSEGDGGDNDELSLEEFIGGMRQLKGEARAKDILKLYREVRILEESIREMEELSKFFMKQCRDIRGSLNTTFAEMDAVRRTLVRCKEMARLAAKSQPLSSFTRDEDESP